MSQTKKAALPFPVTFKELSKRSDIFFALGLVGIIVVLILPMPKWFMDVALALSIMVSVLILMTTLFIEKPLDFSSFPTVLLVSTMLRLSLNLASTRLILSHGHEGIDAAGEVIKAFGNFVMGGNFVIGIIVFIILIIVNFVVITKGSGRIAEVSARFSLDAMPGKQMAIDADLSSGLIKEDEARTRRKELTEETNFYGAMDGAAKFVRGDAVAGVLITVINIIGGIIIGVVQNNISFADALHSYTLLTVGDGLVAQIPSLIISVAAGLLVSKGGTAGTADQALMGQLGGYPTAIGLSSLLMVCLGMLPGLPKLPFMFMAAIMGYVAWVSAKPVEVVKNVEEEKQKEEENLFNQALNVDQIRLELGYGLLPILSREQGEQFTSQVRSLRKQIAADLGFVIPPIRIQDNLGIPNNIYVIKIKEVEAARSELKPGYCMAMDPSGGIIRLQGEPTIEPAFGLSAQWIDMTQKLEAEARNYTVVDNPTIIITHLTEVIKDNLPELLSYAETQILLDGMEKIHQKMVADLVPSQISMASIQKIFQILLAERISIKDLPTILEGIHEGCMVSKNPVHIAEHVRSRLARQITSTYLNHEGILPIVVLSPQWEQAFIESLVGEGETKQLAMAPSKLQEFVARVKQVFDGSFESDFPVLLTAPYLRPYIRSVIERFRPTTIVMSQNEIHAKAKIKTVGQI